MKAENTLAFAALILGSLLLSMIGVLYKIAGFELGVVSIFFSRLWIAVVGLGIWGFVRYLLSDKDDQKTGESVPLRYQLASFLLAPISFLIYQLLWIYSIQETSVAISTVLHYLMPVYTAILAWIFFGERFQKSYWISLGVVMTGVFLLGQKDMQIAFKYLRADFIALLSGFFHAVYLIFSESLSKYLSTFTIVFRICVTGSLCSLVILLARHETIFPHSTRTWIAVIILGLGCQLLGIVCITYSLRFFSASFVALFLLLEPVLGSIEAYFVLSEHLSFIDMLAFLIVLSGISVAILGSFKSDKNELDASESQDLSASNS